MAFELMAEVASITQFRSAVNKRGENVQYFSVSDGDCQIDLSSRTDEVDVSDIPRSWPLKLKLLIETGSYQGRQFLTVVAVNQAEPVVPVRKSARKEVN